MGRVGHPAPGTNIWRTTPSLRSSCWSCLRAPRAGLNDNAARCFLGGIGQERLRLLLLPGRFIGIFG